MDNQFNQPEDRIWSILFKKLTNEANPEDLQELDHLLQKNPELQHQAELISQMWKQSSQTNPAESEAAYIRHLMNHKNEFFDEEIKENSDPIKNETPDKQNFSLRLLSGKKLVTLFAGIIIAGLSMLFIFFPGNKERQPSHAISSIATKKGNRTKIDLPDGTQVWLNAGSKLDYNNRLFNLTVREVTLEGEAFFDVARNINKPFIIHTKKMDIKVLGTVFNVRSYHDESVTEAALIKGSIEVVLKDRKDQKIILKPNEKISITSEEVKNLSVTNSSPKTKDIAAEIIPKIVVKELQPNSVNNIITEIAWTQNKLYFENESLDNVSLKLERWFGKKLVIQNEKLKKVSYTGSFENESLEQILVALKLSSPFNFKTENDSILIY